MCMMLEPKIEFGQNPKLLYTKTRNEHFFKKCRNNKGDFNKISIIITYHLIWYNMKFKLLIVAPYKKGIARYRGVSTVFFFT